MRWLLFLPVVTLFSLDVKPWLGEPYVFEWLFGFEYQKFPNIADSTDSEPFPGIDRLIEFGAIAPLSPKIEYELELAFWKTLERAWGFDSVCLQGRYLWLDDVQGDPVSLTTALSARFVGPGNLRDPSCPYHNAWDFELSSAVGKEWSRGPYWIWRTFAWLSVGQGTTVYPWARTKLSFAGNLDNTWRAELFADGYFGFGNQKPVDPHDFHSYARIGHRSVDVGARLEYKFDIWGMLILDGFYRVYARAYPERSYSIAAQYRYPFSPV